MIIAVTNKQTGFIKNWRIEDYDDLHDFCSLYNVDMHANVDEHIEDEIIKELRKINSKKYIFEATGSVKEAPKPNNIFELHLFILNNFNNIHYYNEDVIDNDLLGKILISNCNKDCRSAEYLLNHLTYKWFSKSVAKKVYELLLKSDHVNALMFAHRIKECRYWSINENT